MNERVKGAEGNGGTFQGEAWGRVGLRKDNNIEVAMGTFEIMIIGSVEKGRKDSGKRLDQLEADFQHRLMCMEEHGGLNLRNETRRQGGKQQT